MPLVLPAPIDTPRLCVRPIVAADLPALFAVNSDELVTQYLPYATWHSEADAEAWLQRMLRLQATGTSLQLVIVDKASARAIGTCLLFEYSKTTAQAELGYALGREYWGRGLMHEALRALMDCAFNTLHLDRLIAEADLRNTRSIELLRRLGFSKVGTQPIEHSTKGLPTQAWAYAVQRADWSGRA